MNVLLIGQHLPANEMPEFEGGRDVNEQICHHSLLIFQSDVAFGVH